MRLREFIEKTPISGQLVRAVVAQVGGWSSFKETAPDVFLHGADSGFSGFTYYRDTCRFTARHRALIAAEAETLAADLGENTISMVRGFNCLGGETSERDVALALYGGRGGDKDGVEAVENALAWFALEEVCRAYADID